MQKTTALSALALAAALVYAPAATAGYDNYGGPSASPYALLTSAWGPGGTTRAMTTSPAPGGATWSIMGAGIVDGSGFDPHAGSATTLLTALYAGGMDEVAVINAALNAWASVSGFTNLGQVADGGGSFGAAGAAGGTGNIRIGAVFIDGATGANVLAHAYQPGDEIYFGAGGNIAGDVHFDNANLWSDGGGSGTIDFYTVALHELGHALGLGHSTVSGSVMEATYAGARRTLTADDIAGITAIYGPVPEPETYLMMMAGVAGLLGVRRWRDGRTSARVSVR